MLAKQIGSKSKAVTISSMPGTRLWPVRMPCGSSWACNNGEPATHRRQAGERLPTAHAEPPLVLNRSHARPPNCTRAEAKYNPHASPSTCLKFAAATLAITAALWALAIGLLGGFTLGAIAASDPLRPLIVAVAAGTSYLALAGVEGARRDLQVHARRLITLLAIVIAVAPAVAGVARNSWTAGGADSYAYVSQADGWLRARLKTPVPVAVAAPWPDAVWTLTPYGYRPSVDGASLVPVTAPGLPLLMAGAKAIAGHSAMFWIPPMTGALLVWITFAIGRRLGSPLVGLAAAWLAGHEPGVPGDARIADERRAGFRVLGGSALLRATHGRPMGCAVLRAGGGYGDPDPPEPGPAGDRGRSPGRR